MYILIFPGLNNLSLSRSFTGIDELLICETHKLYVQ
jgi:hypothetical protein